MLPDGFARQLGGRGSIRRFCAGDCTLILARSSAILEAQTVQISADIPASLQSALKEKAGSSGGVFSIVAEYASPVFAGLGGIGLDLEINLLVAAG